MPGTVPVTAPWWGRYVGLPYVDGGRGPQAVDCWGLIVLIYRERLGIELPSYGEISAADLLRIARAIASGSGIEDGWAPVDEPQPYDVVMMRSGRGSRATVHVGIMVTDRLMLHAEAGMGSGVVPVSHYSVAGRILGYRRHASRRLS